MAYFQKTDDSGVLYLAPGDNVAVATTEMPAGTIEVQHTGRVAVYAHLLFDRATRDRVATAIENAFIGPPLSAPISGMVPRNSTSPIVVSRGCTYRAST